ncbi:MAG: hypothetical protein WCV92_02405 [Candidatus Buchananbacteria bacterium]
MSQADDIVKIELSIQEILRIQNLISEGLGKCEEKHKAFELAKEATVLFVDEIFKRKAAKLKSVANYSHDTLNGFVSPDEADQLNDWLSLLNEYRDSLSLQQDDVNETTIESNIIDKKIEYAVANNVIELTGQMSRDVLGGALFSTDDQMMIRGFADLRDLAVISEPCFFNQSESSGYQRKIIEEHAKELKIYFESSLGYKFVPEIILSIRRPENCESIKIINPTKENPFYKLRINLTKKDQENVKIYRIDGNHRLHYANELAENPIPESKYIIPYCILILGDDESASDNIAEAIIFHNINSKAVPIDLDHAINILITHEQDENKLFEVDPKLLATKKLKEVICGWANEDIKNLLDNKIFSRIYKLVSYLVRENIITLSNKNDLEQGIKDKAEEMKAIFDGVKMKGCKICQYFEIVPAIFKAKQQTVNIQETGKLIEEYSIWLESNNLWTHFPEYEYVLFDVFFSIKEGLSFSVLSSENYINLGRIAELRSISNSSFDLKKLIRLSEELNLCFNNKMYYGAGILLRAILDHIPPVFNKPNFSSVASQSGRSLKPIFERLDNSAKDIADHIVHSQISASESLPNDTQVDFRQDLDKLLEEICRKLKS